MASSVDAKLLRQTKFPPEFGQKVDMKKVNIEVMKKWIAGKISEILRNDDDVVIELCFNLLEGERFPDIKVLQIQLTGFLDKDTPKFCKELWTLCLSAQSNAQGVPKELLEAKKLELIQEKIDAEKAAEENRRRKEQEKTRDRNTENVRQRERGDRGRGRGRGGRGGLDFDRRPPRHSRSPPLHRRDSIDRRDEFRGPPQRRETDTYIPGNRGGRRHDERWNDGRRPRSPSPRRSITPTKARPRSITPPKRRQYSSSRSPPTHRGVDRGKGRGGHGRGGDRARSYTSSEASRSRSPRRARKGRSPSRSRSPSPARRPINRRHRISSPSASRSRSRSRSLKRDYRRSGRSKRSPSYDVDTRADTRADDRKGRKYHTGARRSRSPSRERTKKRTRGHASRSRSRSRSPRRRDGRRHNSIERYAPRRRRNTSSVSSPAEKRRKRADSSADEGGRRSPVPAPRDVDRSKATAESSVDKSAEARSPITTTELRERLLREKVKALRNSTTGISS